MGREQDICSKLKWFKKSNMDEHQQLMNLGNVNADIPCAILETSAYLKLLKGPLIYPSVLCSALAYNMTFDEER
jgi:hypothetical protein